MQVCPATTEFDPSGVAIGMDLLQALEALKPERLWHQVPDSRTLDNGKSAQVLGHPRKTLEARQPPTHPGLHAEEPVELTRAIVNYNVLNDAPGEVREGDQVPCRLFKTIPFRRSIDGWVVSGQRLVVGVGCRLLLKLLKLFLDPLPMYPGNQGQGLSDPRLFPEDVCHDAVELFALPLVGEPQRVA